MKWKTCVTTTIIFLILLSAVLLCSCQYKSTERVDTLFALSEGECNKFCISLKHLDSCLEWYTYYSEPDLHSAYDNCECVRYDCQFGGYE